MGLYMIMMNYRFYEKVNKRLLSISVLKDETSLSFLSITSEEF